MARREPSENPYIARGPSLPDVGKADRFGRIRLDDEPSPDPEEFDFAWHMLNIYRDILLSIDPAYVRNDWFSPDGIEGSIFLWADERYDHWYNVYEDLHPPTVWSRELTPSEGGRRRPVENQRV